MIRSTTARTMPVKCPAAIPNVVPMTIAIAVAEKPTSNDAREPQSNRPSTSRPDGSVPSQCPPLGCLVAPRGHLGDVEPVHRHEHRRQQGERDDEQQQPGADHAPTGARRSRVRPRRTAPDGERGSPRVLTWSCGLQAWVEDAVEQVGDEVHDDDRGGEHDEACPARSGKSGALSPL